MYRKILEAEFFRRRAPVVAKELLGKFLVRKIGRHEQALMITEVEAYAGKDDMSSHAANGITERNKVMFGPPGRWYVYFIYGMYHCLNIVTEKDGQAGAVLIRGLEGISGPGKLCRDLKIDKRLYGKLAAKSSGLWVEERGIRIQDTENRRQDIGYRVRKTARVNVGGHGKAQKRLWRFVLA